MIELMDTAPQPQETTWHRMLEATPLRNAAAAVEPDGLEGLRITVRSRRPGWLVPPLSWLLPLRRVRVVRLDRVGSRVWGLCDGERTVEAVVDEFARAYALTFHEARVAVIGYLKQLVQRGALAIEMPAPPP
jgi:hypothetical protein